MAHEWGRFVSWLSQGQNATVVQALATTFVALITLWYAFLTHWIMKATAKQASAALQPVLSLTRFARTSGDNFHTILIQNSSGRPVVFLDVVISCYPSGRKHIVHPLRAWDDQILSSGENMKLRLNFSSELAALHLYEDACAFNAELVVSDLSRQVAIRYEYNWASGNFICNTGLPWKVRWRYWLRPWGWRYYRVKSWFSGRRGTRNEGGRRGQPEVTPSPNWRR